MPRTAVEYLRHYAAVKNWPRLDECADEMMAVQVERDRLRDALELISKARDVPSDGWKFYARQVLASHSRPEREGEDGVA